MTYTVKSQTVTASPAVFTAEDEVTLTWDVTGTGLEDYAGDVWMWSWIKTGCSIGCDAPSNINPATSPGADAALMTRDEVDPNIYRITLIPVDFYNKTPAEIKEIGFLLKGRDWSNGQTGDKALPVQPLEFVATENRTFPVKFTQEDLVTFYFDQTLTSSQGMKAVSDVYVYFFISGKDSEGADFTDEAYVSWGDVGLSPELQFTNRGNGLFSLTILPKEFFGLAEGDTISKISYIFRNAEGSAQTSTFTAFTISTQ